MNGWPKSEDAARTLIEQIRVRTLDRLYDADRQRIAHLFGTDTTR